MDPELIARSVRAARDVKIPAEEIWYRRVTIGVFAVLGQLHACANWHRIARESVWGDPPATDLGRAEHAFFERGR
jgi:hypothetical protein